MTVATQRPWAAQYRATNPVLQNLVISYATPEEGFIGQQLLPAIPTGNQQTGTIYTISDGDMFGDATDTLEWGVGSEARPSVGFGTSTATYACERFGNVAIIPFIAEGRSQLPLSLKMIQMQIVMRNLLIEQERRIAAAVFNSTTFTQNTTLAGADQWMDSGYAPISTADPVQVILEGIYTVEGATGRRPKVAVFGRASWHAFLQHPAVLDFLSTNKDRNNLTDAEGRALVMQRFGFEKVFVGAARRRTSNPLQATVTKADIWGDGVWIGNTNAAGANMGRGNGDLAIQPTAVARFEEYGWRAEENVDWDIDAVKVRMSHSECVVATSAADGYYILDTQAA